MKIEVQRTVFVNNTSIKFQEQINVVPEYYGLLRERLKVKRVLGKNFVRVGRKSDGGYVMVDNFNTSGGVALRILLESTTMFLGIWTWHSTATIFSCMTRRLTHCRRKAINFISSRRAFSALRFRKNLCTRWIIS